MNLRAALVAALTGISLWALVGTDGTLRLQIDSSTRALGGSESRIASLALSFGPARGSIRAEHVQIAAGLERSLREIDGVARAMSLASAEIPQAVDDDIDITPLIARIRRAASEQDAQGWIDRVRTDPLASGRLVTRDGRAMLVAVELADQDEKAAFATALAVRDHIAGTFESLQDIEWTLTGAPLISGTIAELLVQQLIVILPLAILLCAVVLWCAFRSLGVVVSCLFTVAAAVLWTLGASALLGWHLNLVTILVPPLVTTLSVAYSMHVVAAFSDHKDIDAAMRTVRLPLIITAITTMIGLAALAVNPLRSIQQFALLGAVGAAAGAVAADSLLPLLLRGMRKAPDLWPPVNSWLIRRGNAMANFAVDNSRLVTGVGIVLLGIGLIGASQVESGARYVQDLPSDHPARVSFERYNAQFSGANSFQIHIAGAGEDVILKPNLMRAVDDLQTWLEQQPQVGETLSLFDYLKRINQVFAGDDPAEYRIPESQDVARQLLTIAAPAEALRLTNLIFSELSIEVSTPITDSAQLRRLFEKLEQRLEALPPGVEAELSGNAVTLTRTVEQLTGGQMRSIGIAAVAIFGVLSLLFASARVGLRAMLPNMLPIAVYFGTLGLLDIPLGPTTALVACIVLGIAVDDTLHLLVRFNDLARKLADEEKAARDAAAEVIRPITLTTVAVSLGFLILVGSPFQSQVDFGVLAAFTLVVAWFSDLLLTPAISARASIVTLWDVVRLDLGDNPQETIPLMADMSTRQARMLALYARILKFEPGEDLFRQGDPGREMYVLIDGRMKIWIERRDGEPMALAERGRGTTIGEGGYFNARRTASVTATKRSRVMAFDPESLERIRRRNPRLGALVYRNLNRIQAERIATSTNRLAESTADWTSIADDSDESDAPRRTRATDQTGEDQHKDQ